VSHLVAYLGNEPEHMACALVSARAALSSAAHAAGDPSAGTEPIGWGLGFVQGGEVLLQKRPRAERGNIDFFTLARDLRADAFIARGGLGDELPVSADDADPFRFRWWLMGSVGRPRALEPIRDRVLASIPDFLRRNIRGKSGGELYFHLFLAFLHDDGALETQLQNPEPVARALRESNSFIEQMLTEASAPSAAIASVVTNGRCLVARSASFPIQYLRTTGIMDCTVCRQKHHTNGDGRRYAHEGLRAVVVEADPAAPVRPGWTAVEAGKTLLVDSNRVVEAA
jgi:predicted glutamine amidotransferase